ncbi:hypothetical protein scyTo_0021425 [Scyliorhinus torazame]|uniref:Uncharacterized protein n=1 Tax=Scyliorhinus torazame TaxID=75743 RepID=A0A401Q865_SCYTO|nr:hypothetical protein [Scyliorhinus torazame]
MGPFFLGVLAALFTLILSQNQSPTSRDRPFSVLRHQNLALSVSVLSILLLIMILMIICVYKPIRRR